MGEPVKIGAPHFVDFGKNMEHSPDGKAYLVAHGASDGTNRRFGYNSWITGDEIYLLRVTPGIENMNDASKYEFFAGNDAKGSAIWIQDFAKIKPIAAWRDNMGCVTMTYNAPLKKYLMCVTDGGTTGAAMNTYILESDQHHRPVAAGDATCGISASRRTSSTSPRSSSAGTAAPFGSAIRRTSSRSLPTRPAAVMACACRRSNSSRGKRLNDRAGEITFQALACAMRRSTMNETIAVDSANTSVPESNVPQTESGDRR